MFMKILGSVDMASSAFDLFAPASKHSLAVSNTPVKFTPTSSLTGTGPIEFVVPTTWGSYLDLARSYFHVPARVRTTDGTALTANRDNVVVFPEGVFLHSIFKMVEL